MITRAAETKADFDLGNTWDMLNWCNQLRCSYEELRSAVTAVGNSWFLVRNFIQHR